MNKHLIRLTVLALIAACFAGLTTTAMAGKKKAARKRLQAQRAAATLKPAAATPVANEAATAQTPRGVVLANCTLPGVTVISDALNDEVGVFDPLPPPPGFDSDTQDILSVSIAEPGIYAAKLVFTIKVQHLQSLTPNGSWRVRFQPSNGTAVYFVSMDTDEQSRPSFSYGTFDETTGYSTQGDADFGKYSVDGTIEIHISNSSVGSPLGGQQLVNVAGGTSVLLGAAGTGFLQDVDTADSEAGSNSSSPTSFTYTLVGNATCGTPPVSYGTYVQGGMSFAPNSTAKAPTASSDGEPSSRVDGEGNFYTCGIRGVPAGVDLWYYDLRPNSPTFDPTMRNPIYRGQPDSPGSVEDQNQLQAGALGGGDIDLAIGFGDFSGALPGPNVEPVPALAYSSLTVANLTVGRSLNRGGKFTFNPVGNFAGGVPVNDRQWMTFKGTNLVYMVYRNFAQGIAFVQQSSDGGLTYGTALPAGGILFPQTGSIEVDQTTGVVYVSSNSGKVAVGKPANNPVGSQTPDSPPQTYNVYDAVPVGTNSANIFFPIRVASDHAVYGTYSDGQNIFLVYSTDEGATWSQPVQVNDPASPMTKVNLMPWLATGPAPGSVGIAWFATDNNANVDGAKWRLFYAQTLDARATTPTFRIVQASSHVVHGANISLEGLPLLGEGPNRNLLDYFQINFDPQGAAVISYTDDHNDFDGHTWVARQVTGPSINGNGNLPPQIEQAGGIPANPFALPGATPAVTGSPAPQPMQPGPNGEQVTDFAQDQDTALLAVTPTNSAADIISINYQTQDSNNGFYITATMKVSDLSAVPPNGTWRMYFTANAPETGIIGPEGNKFSSGVSDLGDQFYLEAKTTNGTRSAVWGTVVRTNSGGITRTQRGTADRVFFNPTSGTISVRIAVSKLNSVLPPARPIGFGSVFCGLRGQTVVVNANVLEDQTRGGTEFSISNPF